MSCPLFFQTDVVRHKKEECLDNAYELIEAGRGDEKVKCTVYHGFRSHKSPEEIARDGVDYYHTSYEKAEVDVKEFLEKFDIPYHELDEWEREERWNIWVTAVPDAPCGWAQRSPEAVSLTVDKHVWWDWEWWEAPPTSSEESQWTWNIHKHTDEERREKRATLKKYREWRDAKYGRPMVVVAEMEIPAMQLFGQPQNINTHKPHIPSEEIVGVFECPPERYRLVDVKDTWWTRDKWSGEG